MSKNLTKHNFVITRKEREKITGHPGIAVWFTGLSGSGKSTIANALDIELNRRGLKTYVLDGDNIRMGLNKDLDFSKESRRENIRRVSEVAKLFIESGTIVIAAFISPFLKHREATRNLIGSDYIEIFVDTPIDVCIKRDPKGLYKKAIAGKIKNFIEIDVSYEKPLNPEIILNNLSIENSVEIIINFLKEKSIIN